MKLDEDMKSKKYRLQRDSLRTINASMALFIKLLTKTCEVVQTTSTSSSGGKRLANTIDIEHLSKAVKRYEVLGFLSDLVREMNRRELDRELAALERVEDIVAQADAMVAKRKPDDDDESMEASKKQRSITSFFTRT